MAGSRQKWLDVLRQSRQDRRLPCDVTTLLHHPSPFVRLCAAGVRWAETGDSAPARTSAADAIRSGDRDAVIYGCHLLMELGPAAGDIVPLVWDYLRDPDGSVRGNAAYALFKCCPDKRVLAEAAGLLEADTEDGLDDVLIRYAARKLRKAAEAEPSTAPDRGGTD